MDTLVAVTVPLTVGHKGEQLLEGRVSAAPSCVLPDTVLRYSEHLNVKRNLLLVERNH